MLFFGPLEAVREVGPDGNDDDPGAKLRDAEVRCVKQPPVSDIAQLAQVHFKPFPVVPEHSVEEASDVLYHHCLGPNRVDHVQCIGEKVALVIGTKLLASNREG